MTRLLSQKKIPPKNKVYIRENSWLAKIGGWFIHESTIALTIGNHIYLHQCSSSAFLASKSWVAHELAHVRQFQQYGLVRFTAMYVWQTIRAGYHQNKWEVAARKQEQDLSVLEDFILVPSKVG